MKFKLLAGAALAAVFAATGASAQSSWSHDWSTWNNIGWYGAVDLGYHWPDGISGSSSNRLTSW